MPSALAPIALALLGLATACDSCGQQPQEPATAPAPETHEPPALAHNVQDGADALTIDSDEWVVDRTCKASTKRARYSWAQYGELLAELKAPRYAVVPLREFTAAATSAREKKDKVVIGLRHDVTGNVCKIQPMAKLEHDAGIRSSYFLAHTDKFYGWGSTPARYRRRTAVVPRYAAVQSLGHELGLHSDVLTLALRDGVDPARALDEELTWLRRHGLKIAGVASYGSKLAREAGFVNYELFTGMNKQPAVTFQGRTVQLGKHALGKFDLQYEAYHLGHAHYLSDSGGRFVYRDADKTTYSDDKRDWTPAHLIAKLKTLRPGDSAQLVITPVWWGSENTAEDLAWTKLESTDEH
jgi:hypothetical protein